ncbi:hypothetical protein GCM10011369_07430 [Neiella marina]|uniref:DUF3619 family protein n=1 Tax=Neiella marina TaxID=508461 RepID=A0A8J2U306_9GAMM|nr:hypothetical protein [Neiella marina]GGA68297.1 hypothetical protein GCM10011369_07430 [Neiella marina]
MTSTSKDNEVEQLVNQQLDASSAQLDDVVRNDIASARLTALATARTAKLGNEPRAWSSLITSLFHRPRWQYAMPMVALATVMLVTYTSRQTIPALPQELVLADVPAADLGLLEDLEFATWLAQRQQEAGH